MCSIHNEGKSVVAERFIRTLKNKIYKYMTSIPKNVYIKKLDNVVDEYNNIYHRTIEMKLIDVKVIHILIQWNCILKKKLMIGFLNLRLVIMLEFLSTKIFLLKDLHQTPEEVFVISKIKNTVPWTYVINDLNSEEIIGTFYEKRIAKN